ncbi:MAG: response regulator [Spirochaetales bacterium]|jgi:signal transduction histidine kinase/CheY-like chemotaxis protein|nr:response regulator [Spirochaetales bacterium]
MDDNNRGDAEVLLNEARLTIKKLERHLNLANLTIERNRIAAAAKDNLRKIVEDKSSQLEQYMNLLLQNCPDIIMLFDGEGKIVYCTDIFLKISGIPGFGMIAGVHYRDILLRFTDEKFTALADDIYKGQDQNSRIDLQRPIDFSGKGNPRDYAVQISPMINDKGEDNGAMFLFYDSTDLLRAKQEAEQANKAKSDFLATVSHELRTPLNAIIGISAMMEAGGLKPEQLNYLKNIRTSSHVLLSLINDILDFSKIEAGKLELILEWFNLGDLLARIEEMFALLFPEKDLSFQCFFDPGLPQVVHGDAKRISQILTNLLNNALKYTEQGGVIFRVDVSAPPEDRAGKEGEAASADVILRFVIEDTGIGIKTEAIPRLFAAFEQLDQVRNKQVQGTGLGLAITKRLCDMMSGEITVASRYGAGSVFTVTLPVRKGGVENLPGEEKQAIDFTAPEAKVLLVDDIEINLEIAAFMLNAFGINPDIARGGAESIEKAAGQNYDLILMDHMMPEIDGIDAVQTIRSQGGRNRVVPIVALTANVVSGAREMFLAAGFNSLLSKPMETKTLSDCLLRFLPENLIKR